MKRSFLVIESPLGWRLDHCCVAALGAARAIGRTVYLRHLGATIAVRPSSSVERILRIHDRKTKTLNRQYAKAVLRRVKAV